MKVRSPGRIGPLRVHIFLGRQIEGIVGARLAARMQFDIAIGPVLRGVLQQLVRIGLIGAAIRGDRQMVPLPGFKLCHLTAARQGGKACHQQDRAKDGQTHGLSLLRRL
jgi:hypothetical protein